MERHNAHYQRQVYIPDIVIDDLVKEVIADKDNGSKAKHATVYKNYLGSSLDVNKKAAFLRSVYSADSSHLITHSGVVGRQADGLALYRSDISTGRMRAFR